MTLPADSLPAGLSADEAARRLRADGPNELPSAARRGAPRMAADVLLCLVAGGVGIAWFELLKAISSRRASGAPHRAG